MNLRDYKKENEKEVRKLLDDIILNEFGLLYWKDYLNNKDYSKYIKKGNKLILLLDDDEKIVGTIGYERKSINVIELQNFYISNMYRSKGYGRILYEELLKNIKRENIEKIILYTNREFKIAQKFYKKLGFKFQYENENLELCFSKNI